LPNRLDATPWTPVPCTVLDPFGGSGTTAAVAIGNGRRAIIIELNPEYIEMARQRIGPMFVDEAA
jgi:site-specific DNA-methyltransferase (adenine-specific)